MSVILLGIAFGMIVLMAFLAGVEKGRSVITGVVCAIGASAILGPLLLLIGRWESEQHARMMAQEVDDATYARIAEQKGRSCAVDARVAKAMRDGRITGAEYEPIMELAASERLKGAKTAVAGITANASCASKAGQT
jgi:hypothetical protein